MMNPKRVVLIMATLAVAGVAVGFALKHTSKGEAAERAGIPAYMPETARCFRVNEDNHIVVMDIPSFAPAPREILVGGWAEKTGKTTDDRPIHFFEERAAVLFVNQEIACDRKH